jgi:hypothetical protein
MPAMPGMYELHDSCAASDVSKLWKSGLLNSHSLELAGDTQGNSQYDDSVNLTFHIFQLTTRR